MSTGIFAEVRNSQFAGSFYPREAKALRHEIQRLLQEAEDCAGGTEIFAAAVPHAGYVYSAAIAAPVFKALSRTAFDTVVIIGHDFGRQAPGIIGVLPDFKVYRTPLGDVQVDTALRDALRRDEPRLISNNQVHSAEHSIEVQLPFLQITHPQAKILPLLFGEVTPEHCRALVEVLKKNCGSRRLLVLSSTDLSHYPGQSTAVSLDRQTVSFAERFDVTGLCKWRDGGDWEKLPGVETPICSAGGLGVAMLWAQGKGATRAMVLKRGTSGDIPGGDSRRVVGYTSLLFVKDSPNSASAASEAQPAAESKDFQLSNKTQRYLLTLARQRITAATQGQSWQLQAPELAEVQQPGAVFVTLHKEKRLRGCIGTTRAAYPLYQAVAELAYAAAFEDSRFPQVTAAELPALDIEISVLSPLQPISSADAIIPGKHGVVVRRGGRSGLFLPQVWEQLPVKEDFLGYLCAEKAGLPPDAWKDSGTTLYIFTVFSFTE